MKTDNPFDLKMGELTVRNLMARQLRLIMHDGEIVTIPRNTNPLIAKVEEQPVLLGLPFSATYSRFSFDHRQLPPRKKGRLHVVSFEVARYAMRDDMLCPDPGSLLMIDGGTTVVTNRLISFGRVQVV